MNIAVIMFIIIIMWNDLNAHFYAFNQFQVSALSSVLSTPMYLSVQFQSVIMAANSQPFAIYDIKWSNSIKHDCTWTDEYYTAQHNLPHPHPPQILAARKRRGIFWKMLIFGNFNYTISMAQRLNIVAITQVDVSQTRQDHSLN